eukprot:CAMPEP_0168528386 /NCGR_PEP_ID=MMETSP0405-20121227/13218_1 /TAXON_ID=498012 /ORGANISM="Trichosphaerium sp, Strain Am-I-7 wt" /LENGTH=639 /DNA_ID=CAMNT_0008551781 /DNA_START=78 /DNA_END=1995 /DNA_ORIENTATION=-
MTEALNLLVIQNAKTIAVFYEDSAFTESVAQGSLRTIEFLGLELVYFNSIPFSPNATLVQPHIENLIESLKEIKPDVLLGGTFFSCSAIMKTAREMDFNANAYLFSSPCVLEPEDVRAQFGQDGKYVMSTGGLWDKRLRSDRYDERDETVRYHHFISTGNITSPLLFNQQYEDRFGVEPGYNGMIGYTQGYIVQYALETANSFDSDVIQNTINALDITGFCGEFEFDRFGQNLGRNGLTYQYDDDLIDQIVAPLFAVTSRFIYPAPKWDERKTTYGWYKYTSEVVILSLVSAAILITVSLMIWVLIYQNNRVIRAAQPVFVVLTLIGTIIMYCSVFFWTLHTDDLHCNLVRWLLAIGFGLTYGALFARIYRIGQIFLVKSLEVFKVTNMMIIPIVASIVAIEIVVLVLWTAISTGRAELREEAPFILSDNYYACSNTTTDTIFFVILMIFNAGVLVYGLYWVYRIWRLKAVLYNESKSIGFAVYTLAFFIIIIIIIQVFGADNREIAFILRSLCIVLGPFISVMALLVPRMRYMIQVQSEINKSTNSSGVSRSLTTIKPSGTVHSDVDLKKNMARMKRRIRKLETALAKATGGTLETIREEISDSEDEAPIDEVTEAKAPIASREATSSSVQSDSNVKD